MLPGIDISKYQTTTPSLAGLSFVVLRATIGTVVDEKYATHYANARKAGVVVMAYHYGYPEATVSVAAQAAKFLAIAKDADFLWLDQEQSGFDDAQATQFIAAVRAAGRPCGLYHSSSGFGGVPCDARWVADWRSAAVTAGHPLTADGSAEFPGWDLWQWQGSPLDRDYLNPASPLAALLRKGYITKTAADAAVAALNAKVATLAAGVIAAENEVNATHAALDAAEAQIAQITEANKALGAALDAAPGIERERIAQAMGNAEAERVRTAQ